MGNTVYYDFSTNNLSFIKTHNCLKLNGVENNKFFLAVYDKDLVGLNLYSDELSLEMQKKVMTECYKNPWYFLREVVRIPSINDGLGYFELNITRLMTLYVIFNNIKGFAIRPRQTGRCTEIAATILYNLLFNTTTNNIVRGKSVSGSYVGITMHRMLTSIRKILDKVTNFNYIKFTESTIAIDDNSVSIKSHMNITSKEAAITAGATSGEFISIIDDIETMNSDVISTFMDNYTMMRNIIHPKKVYDISEVPATLIYSLNPCIENNKTHEYLRNLYSNTYQISYSDFDKDIDTLIKAINKCNGFALINTYE